MGIIDRYLSYNAAKKRFDVDLSMRYVLPYHLGYDKNITPYPFSVPASPTIGQAIIRHQNNTVSGIGQENYGTPFIGKYLMFQDSSVGSSSAVWTARLRHMNGRDYMNGWIHIRALAGTAKLPFVIREPLILFSQESIVVETQKTTGGAVNSRVFLAGEQYFPSSCDMNFPKSGAQMKKTLKEWVERSKYVYPFWLTTDADNGPPPIALTGNQTSLVTVKVDANFEVFAITVISTGDFAMDITEVRTGATLTNGRFTANNGIGDATYPTILPFSYLMPAGSLLKMTMQDTSGSNNNIYICFHGRKINAPLKDIKEIDKAYPIPGARQLDPRKWKSIPQHHMAAEGQLVAEPEGEFDDANAY